MHDVNPRLPEYRIASLSESWRAWIPLIVGTLLAFALLEYARAHWVFAVEQAAYGRETSAWRGDPARPTQCADSTDSHKCIDSWRAMGSPPAALWLGNSQLQAINRQQPGETNAPELVREALNRRGLALFTYAQPNANLLEQKIQLDALVPVYKPKLVILPVCYDDLRELAVRESVAAMRSGSAPADLAMPHKPAEPGKVATDATVQARVESAVTGWLGEHWALWEKRDRMRGVMGFAIHTLRNQLLGIHSTSKRPVDGHIYAERMALLDTMVRDLRAQGVAVLLYVPPYRQDIDGPYVMPAYRQFKTGLQALAERHGARFADFDPIVPGPEWATVTDDLFGFQEPDFMHFTAAGHQRLAAGVDGQLRAMGY